MRKIWINCGELSGDIQTAEIVKALKNTGNEFDFVGMGGDSLKKEGVRILFHINELSVMGISEVLEKIPNIIKLLKQINIALEKEKPDAIIVTDAPDFNFRIINMAKKLAIPVYYFIPPKVWAWRKYRINFLQKNVKKIYSILPFEIPFYKKNNVAITYIGNPLVNIVNYREIDNILPLAGRIGLMPGSRKKEISSLLPEYANMAEELLKIYPTLEFYLIKAPHYEESYFQNFWNVNVPITFVKLNERYKFIPTCELIVAASGTAVLETALLRTPTIVTYKVKPFSYAIGKLLVDVDFVSLPNLIMDREVFPELLQDRANSHIIEKYVQKWLDNKGYLEAVRKDCEIIREQLGKGNSAELFAEDFCKELKL